MSKFPDFALRKWGRLTFGGKVALICLVLGVLFGFGYSDGSPPYGIFIFAVWAAIGIGFNHLYYKFFWSRELVQCETVTTVKVWEQYRHCPNCSSALPPVRIGKRQSLLDSW